MTSPPTNDDELATGTWLTGPDDTEEALCIRRCRLEVLEGPDRGKSVLVSQRRIVIGREGGDLVLADPHVSSLHAELLLDSEGYRLRDLGSTNGTRVWGMRVQDAFIAPGTVMSIGQSVVRFEPLPEAVEVPLSATSPLEGMLGTSIPMRQLFHTLRLLGGSELSVLLTGETGTGKGLAAQAIHAQSSRREGPFVVLDCAAVPHHLFEDQLFGHEAGAFTDAAAQSTGVFAAADGGTLFLDELGELPLPVQAKLLRVVETGEVRRIGGTETRACDVRLIAATNRDLRAEVNRKNFRADLYFRIATAHIEMPPLRSRPGDIALLVDHFTRLRSESGQPYALPSDFLEWAKRHHWPGNVRELGNAVDRALLDLPKVESIPLDPSFTIDIDVPFKAAKQQVVSAFERRYLETLLDAHDQNIAKAARAAKVDRMSIYKMLRRLNIHRP